MAQLVIIAVGKLKDGPERLLTEEYLKRARPLLPRLGLQGIRQQELPESRARSAAERQRQEAQAILKVAGDGVLLALDERGAQPDSPAFARQLQRLARGAKRLNIVIGGPDGLHEEVRQRADGLISFGRLTWPHRLVRAMLAEQLYRAATIAANLPYHRP